MHILMGVLVVLMLLGCGQFVNQSDIVQVVDQRLPMCPPEQALVYFLSYESMIFDAAPASALALVAFRDDTVIGVIRPSSYFYVVVEPGKHDFWVDSGLIEKGRERVSLVIKPGKTYFIRWSPPKFFTASKLELISEDVATTYLSTLDHIEIKNKAK